MSYTIQQVKEKIKGMSCMSELKQTDFGEEGGLADSLVSDKKFREALKPTQLRKIFDELKSIYRKVKKEDKEKDFTEHTRVMKLITMLAYSCGRELIPMDFYDIMTTGLKRLKKNEDFLWLHEFVEAILAFHKLRGKYPKERR